MKLRSQFVLSSLFLSTSFFTTNVFATASNPETVNVYTYDSFTSEWGAGPQLKKAFEQSNAQCKVEFMAFGDAGTMFNRLRLEGDKTKADIALGLDNFNLADAHKSGLFQPAKIDASKLDLPTPWTDATFVPYDFGAYAFIYDKNKLTNPPKSLKELVERQDLRVIYQDPRTSSVGRGLLVWLNQVYPAGEVINAWQQLAKHTVTVGKGWSDTYGAFLKGEADLVLSYSTSPLYHQLFEQKDHYAAAEFSEGSLQQVEVAGKLASSNKACADQFLTFLLEPQSQKIIAQANVMLPVIKEAVEPHFDAKKQQAKQAKWIDTSSVTPELVKSWVEIWQKTLTQ